MGKKSRKKSEKKKAALSTPAKPTSSSSPTVRNNNRGLRFMIIFIIVLISIIVLWEPVIKNLISPKQENEVENNKEQMPTLFDSQENRQSLYRKIELQRVAVVINFESNDGKRDFEMGGGFIINGKYVATCYHLQTAYPGKITSAFILYSKSLNSELYDSVPIDLNYKPTISQYDFSKHKYDSNDHSTDFIIYKLQKEIDPYVLDLSTSKIKVGDSVFAIANIPKSKSDDYSNTHSILGRSKYLFSMPESRDDCYFYFCLGNLQAGFSGSPLYNVSGQIVGMYQFEGKFDESHLEVLSSKGLPKTAVDEILEGYGKGLSTGAYLSIDYILKRYMQGYLK